MKENKKLKDIFNVTIFYLCCFNVYWHIILKTFLSQTYRFYEVIREEEITDIAMVELLQV
jgi:hypothetical protein